MSENELNKYSPADENASNENLSRAEKILAIKRAMNRSDNTEQDFVPENTSVSEPVNVSVSDIVEEYSNKNSAPIAEWESELAERIALRVQGSRTIQQDLNSLNAFSTETDEINSSTASDVNANVSDSKEDVDSLSTKVMDNKPIKAEAARIINDNPEEAETKAPTEPESTVESETTAETEAVEGKKKKKFSLKKTLLGLIPHKKDSLPEIIRKVVFLVALVVVGVCTYHISDYFLDNAHTRKVYDDLMDDYTTQIVDNAPQPDVNEEYWSLLSGAKNLLDINKDVVGVIEIPGADLFYPVLQAENNDKYLNINIKGEEAKAGAIFMDYRNSFDKVIDGRLSEPNSHNLIIYGHNMANGDMFGSLKQYRNNIHYYGENPVINLNSNYACYQYKIFAFFIVDAFDTTETYFDYWNKINFNNEEEFYSFVNEAKRRTIRLNDVDVKYGDELLTLSTCNGIFGEGKGGRFVVLARKLRDGEDLLEGTQNSTANPNIKWPSIYYKYNKNSKYDPDAEFVPYG